MKNLIIYFLVLFLSTTLPAWCTGLEKIASLKCGEGEMDFPFPKRGYFTGIADLPCRFKDNPFNQIWLTGRLSAGQIIVLDQNAEFVRSYSKAWDKDDKSITQVVGFFDDGTACVRRGNAYGTDIQTVGVWDLNTDRWELINLEFDKVDLTPYFEPRDKRVPQMILRSPNVADDYIIFPPSKSELEALAFNREGKFSGKVPYVEWSKRGVGAELHYSYRNNWMTFYITDNGEFGAPVNKKINLYLNDVYPGVAHKFLQFDDEGRYYIVGFGSGAWWKEWRKDGFGWAEDGVRVVAIRFDPFTEQVECLDFIIPCELNRSPYMRDGMILSDGSIIISGVQPEHEWDAESIPGGMVMINNPEDLKVHLWKIEF
jgi:hypothetical protein